MRKVYTIQGYNYTVFMEIITSRNEIRISVCNGSQYEYSDKTKLFLKRIPKNSILDYFGFPLEKRTTEALRILLKKMNKHANKYSKKQNKLQRAYEEAQEIFTLDEKMDL